MSRVSFKYREKYKPEGETDSGMRLIRNNLSVVMQFAALSARLTPAEMTSYTKALDDFRDATRGRSPIPYEPNSPLTTEAFREAGAEPFYKYVSPGTLEFIKAGSFRFGTAHFYRTTTETKIRDQREGASTFHLMNANEQLTIALTSGFNCALFCGISKAPGADHRHMQNTFGPILLKIDPLEKFIERASHSIGAIRARVFDVLYFDSKHFVTDFPTLGKWNDITGGQLDEKKLRKINMAFFETFYETAFKPSLFLKPKIYSVERERRIAFEMPEDIKTKHVSLNDPSLMEFITVMPEVV